MSFIQPQPALERRPTKVAVGLTGYKKALASTTAAEAHLEMPEVLSPSEPPAQPKAAEKAC